MSLHPSRGLGLHARRAIGAFALWLLVSFASWPCLCVAQTPSARVERAAALDKLLGSIQGAAVAEGPRVSRTGEGYVRFLGAPPGGSFPSMATRPSPPESAAAAFIEQWKSLFSSGAPHAAFEAIRTKTTESRSCSRFGQTYGGLEVFGAQILVQVDASGGIVCILSDIMRDTADLDSGKVSIQPTISDVAARAKATEVLAAENKQMEFEAAPAGLAIYDPSVVGLSGPAQLVWRTIVANRGVAAVKEEVLVDAHTGAPAFRYPLIYDAQNRTIHDANGLRVTPGTLVRGEGQLPCLIADADDAYDMYGDTYSFYLTNHDRDSIDDAGMTMDATVRYGTMKNAYWNGSRMVFGPGFVQDDVVAHELTHGVTQYESGLIYSYQSGAINESFSDMWGEWVDLGNGRGDDSAPVRWLIGEDLAVIGGAIRDMQDPPAYGDPDRMGSPLYYEGSDDYGGVHTNSGVGNKLCYLLTDGGTFNGHAVAGMDVALAADLMYECQCNLLVPSSDYADLYDALTQAAINLELGQAQRDSVEEACQAVEIAPSDNDYFTEVFESADNDLDNWSLTFTPNGSEDFYRATGENVTAFPTDPSGGTVLLIPDDASAQVTPGGGAQVSLYGKTYLSFYVGSNGYVTFGSGDSANGESPANHFDLPRVSAAFDDLNPETGGVVSWKQIADRVAVTFQNVPEYPAVGSNSFQIEMFLDGTIRVTWLGLAMTDGLAGLSAGAGVPPRFGESDLRKYPASFGPPTPFDPNPADGALSVPVDTPLSWNNLTPGADSAPADIHALVENAADNFQVRDVGTVYDVYFGRAGLTRQMIYSGPNRACPPVPSPLSLRTDYEWQLVATDADGSTTGPLWSFKTEGGWLRATLLSTEAIAAGAQWRVVGETGWTDSGVTVLLRPGNKTLRFKNVPDYLTPPRQTVPVQDYQLTTATATYRPGLQATIDPPDAVAAGAMWRVIAKPGFAARPWRPSGYVETGLAPGDYTIRFKDLPGTGWKTPANQLVTIVAGVPTITSGTYMAGITAVILPPEVIALGAQWRIVGIGGWTPSGVVKTGLAGGSYTVRFRDVTSLLGIEAVDVPGWTTPANQTATFTPGQPLVFTGTYLPRAPPLLAGAGPARMEGEASTWTLH